MLKPIAAAFALATLAVLSLASSPARAGIEYPWCAQYSDSTVGAVNCGFSTIAQCRATISGLGGICYENPAYPTDVVKPLRTRSPHRR